MDTEVKNPKKRKQERNYVSRQRVSRPLHANIYS